MGVPIKYMDPTFRYLGYFCYSTLIVHFGSNLTSKNYEHANIPTSDESITINENDYRMDRKWQMRKNVDKHIRGLMGNDTGVPDDINVLHNLNAGRLYPKAPRQKTGTEPSPSIRDVIDMIEMNIKLGKISQEVLDNNTFVFVSVNGKQFILTVR